jgi:hypothetical protein
MKHLHQTRALLLGWGLLVFAPWSAAQVGFLAALNRTSKAAIPVSEPTASEPKPEPITIPAGTHLLMKLISPLHTTSATLGSGVYLETAFPVVANSRVVIPEHTRVMGVVADERRPGRVQGRAQMHLRFTQLILPNNRELSVVGNLQSLPGSNKNRTINNEGTLEPVDQIDADVYTVAKTTGLGVLIGSLSHAGLAGVGYGAVIGGGVGLAKVLFTRGDEISLPVGTRVEMILKRPLTVQPAPPSKGADSTNAPDVKPEPATARREFAGCPRSSGCDTPGTVTSSPVSFALEH